MHSIPDAILIHAYWLSDEKNRTTVSLRGKFALHAASLLFAEYNQPYLVIAGGEIWGPTYPSLGNVMAEELREVYGIPKSKIIVRDVAYDTNDEVNTFIQLAHKYNWENLMSLASKKHFWTIPLLYKNRHIKASFMAVEDVLKKKADVLTIQQVKKFQFSKYELNFLLYMLAIRIVLYFDPQYKRLGKRARQRRLKKHHFGLLPFLPADIYKI